MGTFLSHVLASNSSTFLISCHILFANIDFLSGPNPNSASFGTKSSNGRPPQSSSNAEKNSVLSVKDSTSCDLQHCNGHGNCITEGKVTHCQCMAGYKGEFCQDTETGKSHVAVILGVLCLIAALMSAAFIFAKRYWPMWKCFCFAPWPFIWKWVVGSNADYCVFAAHFTLQVDQLNSLLLWCLVGIGWLRDSDLYTTSEIFLL